MKDTTRPMKSIRQEILIAPNKHGEQTVDDLLDQLNGDFTRKDVASNISQFSVEGLTTRRKDGTTGLPAYKITELGKSRIKASVLGHASPAVMANLTTSPKNSSDQRAMDLGHEYHQNDGGGMQASGEAAKGLPAPGDETPTDEDLQLYYEAGYSAAQQGKTKDECPQVRSELVAEWVRGFNQWHEDNPANGAS